MTDSNAIHVYNAGFTAHNFISSYRYPLFPQKQKIGPRKEQETRKTGARRRYVSIKVGIKSVSALFLGQFSFSIRGFLYDREEASFEI